MNINVSAAVYRLYSKNNLLCKFQFNIEKIFCAKVTPIDGKFIYKEFTLEQLLPDSFGPEDLLLHSSCL